MIGDCVVCGLRFYLCGMRNALLLLGKVGEVYACICEMGSYGRRKTGLGVFWASNEATLKQAKRYKDAMLHTPLVA